MKMNPPTSSNSPISRKKPRIMRHLYRHASQYSLALPGRTRKFNLVSTLPVFSDWRSAPCIAPESVDAPTPCLYKGADGGGCNPAAAVSLGVADAFEHIGSGKRHAQERSEPPAASTTPSEQATRLSASKTQATPARNSRRWTIPLPPRRRRARLPAAP